jgi:glutamate-1-semialdehyde 2,1-aminomutase
MHALRLARAYTGRSKVLIFTGGYHGSHDVAIVGFRGPAMASTGGVPDGVIKDTLLANFNDVESVQTAFAMYGDEIAAVMMEPQQRSVDPLPGFLQAVVDTAHEHGAITIFDEVLTGFRLAYGGAQEYYGVQPDLVCYGKIVGGGFPLSAVAGKREIMGRADPKLTATPDFVHLSGTMSGNPVSAAAGLATLDELGRPGVYERLHEIGRRLRNGLQEKMDSLNIGGIVVGSGPIAFVRFDDSSERGAGVLLRDAVNRRMMGRGVLVQMQTRFYLSLAHTDNDVDFVVDAFGESLRVATKAHEIPVECAAE